MPKKYIQFSVVLSERGLPIFDFTANRNEIAAIADSPNSENLILNQSKILPAEAVISNVELYKTQINELNWSLGPYYRLHLFDPGHPLYYDLGPELYFQYQHRPGIYLNSRLNVSLLTEFDKIHRGTKGNAPNVRTKLRYYLNKTGPRISELTGSSYYKIGSDIYGRFTLGYFEPMFGGFSSEILKAPINSNFALGLEINYTKPRSFEQYFEFREEPGMAKLNGHVSAYWDTNYYNYLAQIDFGKYLAGDKGSTLTVTRQFPNGWKAGGFFTRTDLSYEDFGEGSFDKGFFVKIPFASFMPFETRDHVTEIVRPLQGDGGQRVGINGRLYDVVNTYSSNQIIRGWQRLWR